MSKHNHAHPNSGDWLMVDAVATLEWFLAEADRLGMVEPERTRWARARTWEKLDGAQVANREVERKDLF